MKRCDPSVQAICPDGKYCEQYAVFADGSECDKYNKKTMNHRMTRTNGKWSEPIYCGECDYSRDSDMRCMCSDSQWAGTVVKSDNYCRHGVPRIEEVN